MVGPIRKSVLAALTCAALLLAQGWIGTAVAAEWPTWPRPKPPASGTTPAPHPESEAAAEKGEEDGKKAAGWLKTGTVAKAALVAAGIAGVAIAIGSGSSSSNH